MTRLTAIDRTLDLTIVLDILAQEGDAVIIQEDGRDVAVILSPDDYAHLRKLQDQTDLVEFLLAKDPKGNSPGP